MNLGGKAEPGSLWKPEKRKPKTQKPIKQVGKRTIEYNKWRDTVAKPYLDRVFGHICSWCPAKTELDVDHIKGRGSHAELKKELSNVRYLCRTCHQKRV